MEDKRTLQTDGPARISTIEMIVRKVLGRQDRAAALDPDSQVSNERFSVGALIDRYLTEGPMAKPSKRVSTWGIDRSNLERHIRPLLGSVLIGDLTKSDAARAFWDIRNGKTRTDERTGPSPPAAA